MRLWMIPILVAMVSAAHAQWKVVHFEGQLPDDPGVYDTTLGPAQPCGAVLTSMSVSLLEPAAGVTSTTGLTLLLPGIQGNVDCEKPNIVHGPTWQDDKNIVLVNLWYRNIHYGPPYDFGKLQITDVLRAMGAILEKYPQIDRRRLYLYGASGGGHLSLQTFFATRGIWAEVYSHCPITKITTEVDWAGLYDQDPELWGWNELLALPTQQGDLSNEVWNRIQAERALRSPQINFLADANPPIPLADYPPVWMFQGDQDETTDFQHFLDTKAVISTHLGGTFVETVLPTVGKFTLRNWTMFQLYGGMHNYQGAAPEFFSRWHTTNTLVPQAFTRIKPEEPNLVMDYTFPTQHGWTFKLTGYVSEVELHSVPVEMSGVGDYGVY